MNAYVILGELFENVEDKPSIVFVSACHSESVANAFIEAGVPYVISIDKEKPVMDKFVSILSLSLSV